MADIQSNDFWIPQCPVPDKTCRRCKEQKPITDFPMRKAKTTRKGHYLRARRSSYCKECESYYGTLWSKKPENLNKRRKVSRESRKRCRQRNLTATREKERNHQRKQFLKKLGLTMTDIERMLQEQNNRCAICGVSNPLRVDHCHKTGKVRGLLCDKCNMGIGLLQDDSNILRAAAEYIERHAAP